MADILLDTILDTIKLLPFLFITFLIIEYLEKKIKSEQIIKKVGKKGPLVASLLGAFPQCGFSVSATNFYVTKIISIGTLIAVYLSTSDEMIPILIAHHMPVKMIITIIGLKVIIALFWGVLIDFLLKKKSKANIHAFCEQEHCDCKENIWLSALKHTINTIIFIFIITFFLNMAFEYIDLSSITKLMHHRFLAPFISSLVGLIPNCGASIMITESFLGGIMSFGSMMSGLLTGAGCGILVLVRSNKNIKDNLLIIGLLYSIGVISGIIINIFNISLL